MSVLQTVTIDLTPVVLPVLEQDNRSLCLSIVTTGQSNTHVS